MSIIRRMLPAAAAAFIAIPAAAQDLTIVSKVSGPMGTGGTSTQYIASGKFRTASSDNDTILDLVSGKMVFVDHKKKEFYETTLDAMNKMMQAGADMASQAMKDLPPEAKNNPMVAKMMERMGGGGAPAAVKVEKGTSPRSVAGYDCEHWVLSMGDATKQEIWTTTAITFPPQLYDVRKAFYATNPALKRFAAIAEEMRKIKGFTLAETTSFSVMGRTSQTSSEATEVKKGAIPASTFEVPAGYKKGESPFAQMQQARPR